MLALFWWKPLSMDTTTGLWGRNIPCVMAALVGDELLEQGSCCVPSGKNAGEHTHMLDCFKTAATSNNTLLLPGA